MISSMFSSDGISLQFVTEEEQRHYKDDEEQFYAMQYKMQREKHGIWASNQNKFVKTIKELNEWDGQHMENLFRRHYPYNIS